MMNILNKLSEPINLYTTNKIERVNLYPLSLVFVILAVVVGWRDSVPDWFIYLFIAYTLETWLKIKK